MRIPRLSEWARLFRTLRYLRLEQLWGQLWFRIYRPKPKRKVNFGIRGFDGEWSLGISKRVGLTVPDRLKCLNIEHSVSSAEDWDKPERLLLWRYNLHYFDFLNHYGDDAHRDWALDLVKRWHEEHPIGTGWDPYPISLRLVNWIRFQLEHQTLPQSAISSLAVQADLLWQKVEFHIGANHLFANGKALVFAGLFFEGREANRWLTTGIRILNREVPEQFLADGAHYERSPMYHRILLEDLLDLVNVLRCYRHPGTEPLQNLIESKIPAALNWMQGMALDNGDFPLFADSAHGIAPRMKDLLAYADRLGFETERAVAKSVYFENSRMASVQFAGYTLFATLDGPQPSYQPGHSHADSLSFELYKGNRPLVVDGGVTTYAVTPERIESRRTHFQNTVEINGEDSSEVWSGFRVGRRARVGQVRFSEKDETTSLVAEHDGYRFLPGKPVHRREWSLQPGQLCIKDRVWRTAENIGSLSVVSRFRAAPGTVWRQQGQKWILSDQQETLLEIHASAGEAQIEVKVESSFYYPEFGKSEAIQVLAFCLDTDSDCELSVGLSLPTP